MFPLISFPGEGVKTVYVLLNWFWNGSVYSYGQAAHSVLEEFKMPRYKATIKWASICQKINDGKLMVRHNSR